MDFACKYCILLDALRPQQQWIYDKISSAKFFSIKEFTISYNHTCGALAAKPYFEALASSNSRNGEPKERFIRISSRTQDRDLIFYTSIKPLSPAFSKQDLTDGSTLVPPKADISPRTLGTWIQSPSNRPSFLWFDLLDWSAMRRNMSEYVLFNKKTNKHWIHTSVFFFQSPFAHDCYGNFKR